VGGDSCVSYRTAGQDTLLAHGNFWGSSDDDTVASRMDALVDYDPWLPVPPDSIHPDSSYALTQRSHSQELAADDFVRSLCPEGCDAASDFEVDCLVRTLVLNGVEGLDPRFVYLTLSLDDTAPPTLCPLADDQGSACEFWCASEDTVFGVDSTDASGTTVILKDRISGRARVILQLYVGPLVCGEPDIVWVNSFDIVRSGNSDSCVDLSDMASFSAAVTNWNQNGEGTWWCDFVPVATDVCIVSEQAYVSYAITLGDIAAFSAHTGDSLGANPCD